LQEPSSADIRCSLWIEGLDDAVRVELRELDDKHGLTP
jgi:hypothetical protein